MTARKVRPARLRKLRFQGLAGPNLTPMMDMFTIILVFLLKSFSVSYVALKPIQQVELPTSSSQVLPKRHLALDIEKDGIYVETERIQPLKDFIPQKVATAEPTFFILRDRLKRMLERGDVESTVALIRADKDTPFEIIWRVMYTARQLGFEEFQNLVIQGGT